MTNLPELSWPLRVSTVQVWRPHRAWRQRTTVAGSESGSALRLCTAPYMESSADKLPAQKNWGQSSHCPKSDILYDNILIKKNFFRNASFHTGYVYMHTYIPLLFQIWRYSEFDTGHVVFECVFHSVWWFRIQHLPIQICWHSSLRSILWTWIQPIQIMSQLRTYDPLAYKQNDTCWEE